MDFNIKFIANLFSKQISNLPLERPEISFKKKRGDVYETY